MSIATCGRRSSSTCSRTRSSSPSRARSRSRSGRARRRAAPSSAVRDTGIGIPAARAAAAVRALPPRRGRARPHASRAAASASRWCRSWSSCTAARSRSRAPSGQGSAFTVRAAVRHRRTCRAERLRRRAPAAVDRCAPQAYVEEALSWLRGRRAGAGVACGVRTRRTSPAPRRASTGEGRRVLLADDNADMRDYVERLLTRAGYRVEAVADGRAALEAARRASRRTSILTDVMMPELDGFGLLRRVREDPELRDMPVILLSARAGEEARVEGLRRRRRRLPGQAVLGARAAGARRDQLNIARIRRETARLLEEETAGPRAAERGRHHGRGGARPRARGAGRHRRGDAAVGRGVRLVLLQRDRRQGRVLHALHAVRRAARGVREIPDAAQHRGVRADLQGRGHRALGRHHARIRASARTRRTTACPRAICRWQLSRGPGDVAHRRGAGRPVLRPSRGRQVRRPRRAHRRRHRGAGGDRDRQGAALSRRAGGDRPAPQGRGSAARERADCSRPRSPSAPPSSPAPTPSSSRRR